MVGQTVSNPTFDRATAEVKDLKAEPSSEEQLKLYGLYKIGTGVDFKTAKPPGRWDIKAGYKYDSWKKMVEAGIKPEVAQQQYVEYVEKELKPKYGWPKDKK